MTYIEYVKMTPEQQQQVKDNLLTRSMTLDDLPKWMFLTNSDGSVCRRKGMHKPTPELQAQWEALSAETRRSLLSHEVPGDPAKGSIRHFLSGARYNFSRN